MMRALTPRGEGGEAWRSEWAGLGARGFQGYRSGIAETAASGQPVVLAFHGSLYNLKELSPKGGQNSDVLSVILAVYLKEGLGFVPRLRGDFVLALWDGRKPALYLATDPFRVFPLYYYQDGEKLVFASTIPAIRAFPGNLPLTLDPESVVDVTSNSAIPTPRTIYKEIKKAPAGVILSYSQGKSTLSSWWEINFLNPDRSSERELIRRLKHDFTESIALRLESDGYAGDLGTFLSGGVDSSTVTGLVTELLQRPVKTFSIGFDEGSFNEMFYARVAARKFNARHLEYFVKPQDAVNLIPTLVETYGEPFANASAIPTYYCAKLAKENGVNIMYAGDGGDELFGGNQRYAVQRVFDYYKEIPRFIREPILKPMVFAMASWLPWKLLVKGKKYIQRASIPYPDRLSSWGLFETIPPAELFTPEFWKTVGPDYNPSAALNSCYFQAPAEEELDRQLYIDLKLAITDNDLLKVTQMSHAAGVAVRFPFLDRRFAESAATVPARMKMRGTQLRTFFKKAYSDLLPAEVLAKKKHGFGLPIPIWLRTHQPLNDMMKDLVLSRRSLERGIFNPEALAGMVEKHKTDATSFYGTILWNLMILELWHRHHFDRR